MLYLQILDYLRSRFGLVSVQEGQGHMIFKVDRSKLIAHPQMDFFSVRLFADGVEYARAKREAKKA